MFGAGPQPGRVFDYSKILGWSRFQVQVCSESVSYEQTQISHLYIFQRPTRNLKSSPKVEWSVTLSLATDSSWEHGE